MSVRTSEENICVPEAKRRKLATIDLAEHETELSKLTMNGTLVRENGTVTPVASMGNEKGRDIVEILRQGQLIQDEDSMDTDDDECPCGYFHGPGSGHHLDIKAVGLSSEPLLRGPD